MTHVIPMASTRAGFSVQPPAPSPVTQAQALDAIARHQHLSNAISTASWHLHHGRTEQAMSRILIAARNYEGRA